jgi:hypothetical protein
MYIEWPLSDTSSTCRLEAMPAMFRLAAEDYLVLHTLV